MVKSRDGPSPSLWLSHESCSDQLHRSMIQTGQWESSLWTVEGTVNSYLRGFGEGFLSYKFPVRCFISIRFVIRMLQIDKTLQIMICKSKITLSYLWLVKAHFRMSNPNTWFHPLSFSSGKDRLATSLPLPIFCVLLPQVPSSNNNNIPFCTQISSKVTHLELS